MTSLHIECPTGVAGDMLLAGLLDLGVPRSVVDEPLAALGWSDRYRLDVQEGRSGGLRGLRLSVEALEDQPPHRHWAEMRPLFQEAPWPPALRRSVLAVFNNLAEAEAQVHGLDPAQVHFHEVGAIDSVVDVVGVCAALLHLAPERISCDSPPAGRGSVLTAHGRLPVPAPAVLELARRNQIPLRRGGDLPEGEWTTPTGLALIAEHVDRFDAPDQVTPMAVGCGLGHRALDRPNQLRISQLQTGSTVTADEIAPRWQPVVVQEAWVDDASPEDLAVLVEQLRQSGAIDVACYPIQMKKGRSGVAVVALVSPAEADVLRQCWFNVGPTIGLREREQGRWLLPRRSGHLRTAWGDIPAKEVQRSDGRLTCKPEVEGLLLLSATSGQSIAALREACASAVFVSDGAWTW